MGSMRLERRTQGKALLFVAFFSGSSVPRRSIERRGAQRLRRVCERALA